MIGSAGALILSFGFLWRKGEIYYDVWTSSGCMNDYLAVCERYSTVREHRFRIIGYGQ